MLSFIFITCFLILVPISVGIRKFAYLEKEMKWLLYMLIPIAINQFLSIYWSNFIEKNNLPLYYLHILLEILFILMIYNGYLKKSIMKTVLRAAVILFSLLLIIKFSLYPEQLKIYSTLERSIEGIIVLVFAATHLVQQFREQEVMHPQRTSGFWLSFGFSLFFSCNLLLFIFDDLVFAQDKSIFQSIWVIHGIVTILLYLTFTIAFICNPKETKF